MQTVKNVLQKARWDQTDPDLALLCLCTTPVTDRIPSPMKLLMAHRAKSTMPVCIRNTLADRERIHTAYEQRQDQQKHQYDKRAGNNQPALYAGQHVRMQKTDGTWTPATSCKA